MIEAKLAQQLTWVEQEPLYQIFVDLHKAYNHLNQEKCLEIMTGYGVGPKLLRLQMQFWTQAEMVCHAGGSFGKPFAAFWGVTQGGPLSSIMFNVCVDAVIMEWLCRTINKDAASRVFSQACREIVAFFVDDGLVGLRDPIWLQSTMEVLVTLFEGIDLRTNHNKTKVMTCVPGNIWVAHGSGVPRAAVRTSRPYCETSLGGVQPLRCKPSSRIPPKPSGNPAQHVSVVCSQSRIDR
jgi:hypothetical protein